MSDWMKRRPGPGYAPRLPMKPLTAKASEPLRAEQWDLTTAQIERKFKAIEAEKKRLRWRGVQS